MARKMNVRSIAKWAVIVMAGLLIAAQAVRPARTNPPIDPAKTLTASAHVPADVAASLDRACRDCHSNETTWPWYSNVAPVSWFVINHVNDGRREVNLSEWAALAPRREAKKLGDICQQVDHHEMPLSSYLLVHRSAQLSDGERQAICAWTKDEQARLGPLPPMPAGGRGPGAAPRN